jgi:2-polyprenyl-6-hydroxyphenyl methylase / 3-demethylubiquinone-9 3-methyltransferase
VGASTNARDGTGASADPAAPRGSQRGADASSATGNADASASTGNADASSARGNADASELGKFDALSSRFWDPKGEFRPLHVLNPVRARFVAERVTLTGTKVVDVGCGGGLLCEALARAGAQVTGIDLAPGMIEVARLHAADQQLAIDYRVADADAIAREIAGAAGHAGAAAAGPSAAGTAAPGPAAAAAPGAFDVVTCMEMLEHVPDPARMIGTLAQLVRPGGHVFVSTINRNLKSFMLAIVGAEYFLRLIPRGTHEYERLIQPSELAQWSRAAGLTLRELAGIEYNPLSHSASLSRDPSVNYLAHFVRS